ncbi:beta-ribofuranosylaminobenzene 5'-phosphate synthase family protein [Salinirubellus sp. GCM10025818]|uniref:beta-ribofuranosylaminobenzene 5'-phosphate synthase family protein n=1 Tax=Salinirubellus TaxID=2162630 RepID=UPI0030D62360
MPRVTVTTGARLHAGFRNLSLSLGRLYGGVGLALAEPRAAVTAETDSTVTVTDAADATGARSGDSGDAASTADEIAGEVAEYARRTCDLLGLPGARVEVAERLPRHVGLGSGTQLALATYTAVARANGADPRPREHAPVLGRGGRSGVGVATFESGGFVADAGHPTERFTTAPPADGEWTVPAVLARYDLPEDWRVCLVLPEADPGRHGEDEERSIRGVVERADLSLAEELASLLVDRLLPAAVEGRLDPFGAALAEFGRLNGAWYADVQGGVYRPPAGKIVEALSGSSAVAGAGQSSWGPAVWALTDADRAADARTAAEAALDTADRSGRVILARPRNAGATVEVEPSV